MNGIQQTASPLRDRLLSNSPDLIKSSILRESGHGWASPTPTSPLRIAKRSPSPSSSQSPKPRRTMSQFPARRSSNSYKHMRNNNLVSKSPFKSLLPTPTRSSPSVAPFPTTHRRVSGEKRPRPSSLHEQGETENERPFALKRERRQSKGYQGLIQKEPVTKSPFRRLTSAEDSLKPLPPPPPITATTTASPTRSSLVSKRLHGPRVSSLNRRARRKTVTFDERCDVVEFDVEEEEEIEEDETSDDYGEPMDQQEDVFESIPLEHEERPETPPREPSLPPDLETEGGVPYGRSHHHERAQTAHNLHPLPSTPQPALPLTPPEQEPCTPPSEWRGSDEPPLGRSTHSERVRVRHAPDDLEEDMRQLPPSPSPSKRVSSPRLDTREESLIPRFGLTVHHANTNNDSPDPFAQEESRLTDASFTSTSSHNRSFASDRDAEQEHNRSFASVDTDMDPANLSIGHSEVSLSALEAELGIRLEHGEDGEKELSPVGNVLPTPDATSSPPLPPQVRREESVQRIPALVRGISPLGRGPPPGRTPRVTSPVPERAMLPLPSRVASPLPSHMASPLPSRVASPIPARIASPLPSRTASPLASGSVSPSPGCGRTPRLRISREDVQRRLLRKRSMESPVSGEVGGAQREEDKDDEERGTESMSVLTDASAEMATIERAEKRNVGMSIASPAATTAPTPAPTPATVHADQPKGDSGIDLTFDFGTKFGLGINGMDVDMRSALDRLMDDVAESASATGHSLIQDSESAKGRGVSRRVETVTLGVQAGRFETGDDSMMTEEASTDVDGDGDVSMGEVIAAGPRRAATDTAILSQLSLASPPASRSASGATIPPPPPPKDAIKTREEMILEKRRAARRREEQESMGYLTPPRNEGVTSSGRPGRRRSMSTGDADTLKRSGAMRGRDGDSRDGGLLDVVPLGEEDIPLEDSINRELRKLGGPSKAKYQVRERATTIYASSDADRIGHVGDAGDVNGGKAWRAVRRPSDMNEYAKEIKEYQAQEKPGRAHGKVFVKVLGVRGLNLPLPQHQTTMTCTLNNGIHFVTTPECRLARDCRIEQEFELIEHSKLEFTLTLKIKRDPHIIAQFKAIAPPPPPPPPVAPTTSKGGMRSFFSSSPKKSAAKVMLPPPPPPAPVENLARYLKPDGMLARAFISFKDIASRCDTRLFETSYPLIGQKTEGPNTVRTIQVGEIVLQMFRLPPLPGIKQDQLPQSLEECHRGLRHINWHKVTYFEGTLTQNGGDCMSWRRRHLRVIGANLVAFNDVTKKATASIDLRKAISVEDDQGVRSDALSPSSVASSSRNIDEYDGLYGVERSFRLHFPRNQEIVFFADTDEEKARWLEVLRALVGRIPPNPLWAELVWQRQRELAKQASSSR